MSYYDPITIEYAREIASWFSSPGTDGKRFTTLATTGKVLDARGLMADIEREIDSQRYMSAKAERESDVPRMDRHDHNGECLYDLKVWVEENFSQDLCNHDFVAGGMIVSYSDLEYVNLTGNRIECCKCEYVPTGEYIAAVND